MYFLDGIIIQVRFQMEKKIGKNNKPSLHPERHRKRVWYKHIHFKSELFFMF